jgi:hypothetical protein
LSPEIHTVKRRSLQLVSLEDRLAPAVATWDGGGANNLWSNPANWVGDIAPHPGDDLVFGTALQTTAVNDFATGTAFHSLQFSNQPYQVTGNAITLAAGIDATLGAGLALNLDITLSASQNFAVVSGQQQGAIDLNGHVLTLTNPDAGGGGGHLPPPPPPVFTFFGVIQGVGGLIKEGAGRISLSADNIFSGPIDHRAGILIFPGDNSAGASGAANLTMVEPSAVLFISGQRTIPESITFANSDPNNFNPLIASGFPDVVTFTGPITLTGNSRWLGQIVLAGGLFGTGSLSVQGALTFPTGSVSPYTGFIFAETQPLTFDGTGPNGQIVANDSRGVGGTGSIGPLTVQGSNTHLTPGDNGVGTLTTGALVAGCLFDVDINASGADKVVVHGTVALAGTLTIFPASGFTPPANAVYRIIDNDGTDFVGGAFSNLPQAAVVATINGVTLFINYRGGDGNDVELTTTQPSPLPGPRPFFAVGAGPGGGPQVNVYDESGTLVRSFFAYEGSFRGGVHVAVADVTGDGIRDVITGPGNGGGPVIRIWDGATGALVNQFNAYDPNFRGGAFVAAARIDSDSVADVVTGAGPGGGPHVKVFIGATSTVLSQFLAYDPSFTGGVSVAALNATAFVPGTVITGAGPGGGPHVRAFNGLGGGPTGVSFFAYDASFTGGVYVAAGDLNGSGQTQIITGPGSGSLPQVRIFDSQSAQLLNNYNAYDLSFRGGVTVAVTDPDATGRIQIVTGAGPGGGPHVKTWRVTVGGIAPPMTLSSFFAFDPAFLGGVFVG